MDGALTERFEEHRAHLRAVAYRMLGSAGEAEDAVQETWIRLNRTDTGDVANLGGWLTTVVGRVALDMLRARRSRREELVGDPPPEPASDPGQRPDPEHEAVLAESVGVALHVVLERLNPAERVAFVLHDLFAVPFDEIAGIVDRSPEAARQLASRARRRVRGAAVPDQDVAAQREVVDAFFRAARGGDLQGLLSVLDPDVVLRADLGPETRQTRQGAEQVASNALMFATPDRTERPVIVNGQAGVIIELDGEPFSVMAFTVTDGRIVEIEVLADPVRLAGLDLPG